MQKRPDGVDKSFYEPKKLARYIQMLIEVGRPSEEKLKRLME